MPNQLTNTALAYESWNGRGLILHQGVTKALVRADDSTLWAAIRLNHVKEYINILRSTDNGFSWENMYSDDFLNTNRRTGISGLNQNGPVMHLTLSENRDRLILWHAFYSISDNDYQVEPFIFEITEAGLVRKTTTADHAITGVDLNMDQLFFDVSYTEDKIYLTYTSSSVLNVRVYNHTYQTSFDGQGSSGTTFFNHLATHANNNNTLDIVITRDEGATYSIVYTQFNRLTLGFSTPVIISNFPSTDSFDLNIERDATGNLMVLFSEESVDATNMLYKYAISTDNGISWSVEDIPYTPGQTVFRDAITERLAGRTVALAGLGGFLLGYVRLLNGSPAGFLRTLYWNGTSYDLGEEKRVVDENIIGFRFFRPTGNKLTNLDDLGEVRVAYQVGAATSKVQVDVNPVKFGQQLLRESAAFTTELETYDIDTAESDEILAIFNFIGSADESIDYYDQGLVGRITDKYMAAFARVGVVSHLTRYEPVQASKASDVTAFDEGTKYIYRVCIDPITYAFPVTDSAEGFTTYIERDIRKIYIPPNLHLARTFIVNDGNHYKRTVWTLSLDGNEYEISQVAPRLIANQIALYEANAYVIGPSNDPYARIILPSET